MDSFGDSANLHKLIMSYRTLFERDSLTISESPGTDVISRAEQNHLIQLESGLPAGSIAWTAKGLRLGSYCGVLQLGGETLEILPKIFREGEASQENRKLLIQLLRHSRTLPWLRNWQSGMDHQSSHLLDVFIKKFCDDLQAVLAGGMARSYREYHRELPVIRGRLDVAEHSRRLPSARHKVVCRYDEFDEDTPLNRILRLCVEKLSGIARLGSIRRHLEELRFQFDGVSPIHYKPELLKTIRLDRSLARFQDVWAQCCWLLRGLYPSAVAGETTNASLLFDMESLFEEATYRLMRAELMPAGYAFRFQGPQQSLLRDTRTNQMRRRMKPDITVTTPSGAIIILDCKWKMLNGSEDFVSELSHSDLYQLHTYATEYQARAVALLYPWAPGLPEKPVEMRFTTIGIPIWFHFVRMEAFDDRNPVRLTENWESMLGHSDAN
jgi:5-methylcytosine-specific restriction enzyme subunit McrC